MKSSTFRCLAAVFFVVGPAGCGNDDGAAASSADTAQDTAGQIADVMTDGDAIGDGDVATPNTQSPDTQSPDTQSPDTQSPDTQSLDGQALDTQTVDAPGADTAGAPTCAVMSKQLQTDLAAAISAHNTCQSGDTCVIAPTSTACAGTCGQAINQAGLSAVAKVVADLDANLCKANGYAKKCGYATPKCVAPNPGCKAGACVYAK